MQVACDSANICFQCMYFKFNSTGHIMNTNKRPGIWHGLQKFSPNTKKKLRKGSKHFPLTSDQPLPYPRSLCPLILLTSPSLALCCQASSAQTSPSSSSSFSSPNSPVLFSPTSVPSSVELLLLWLTFLSPFVERFFPWLGICSVLLWFKPAKIIRYLQRRTL